MSAQMRPRVIVSQGGLTAITVRAQAIADDGVLSDVGTAVVVTSDIQSLDHQYAISTKNVSASTSPRANNLTIEDDQSLNLNVLLVNNGTDVNPLQTLLRQYTVFKLSWVVGTVSGGKKTRTFYGSCSGFSESGPGKEEMIATASFAAVDPGATDWGP